MREDGAARVRMQFPSRSDWRGRAGGHHPRAFATACHPRRGGATDVALMSFAAKRRFVLVFEEVQVWFMDIHAYRARPLQVTSLTAFARRSSWRRRSLARGRQTLSASGTAEARRSLAAAGSGTGAVLCLFVVLWCILVCHTHLTIIICCTAVWAPGARVGTQNRFRLYRASLVHPVFSIAFLLVLVFRCEQYHDTATSGKEYSDLRILDRPCPVCVWVNTLQ